MIVGMDALRRRDFDLLRGKRVGLLSHQAALVQGGASSAQLLYRSLGARLVALFGPEHGFFGQAAAGASTVDRTHPEWNIPVYSLYGNLKKPTPGMLAELDVIVCDLQDLGYRCYTYLATLHYLLQACQEADVEVVVTDRPIPLPRIVDGPMLEPDLLSFVAPCNLPMSFAMTPAECALWLRDNLGLKLRLHTVAMEGWRRDRSAWDGDALEFMPPSPGIKSWESARCYLATLFTEALKGIDCGRDTNLAFRVLGAPWLLGEYLCGLLNGQGLPGVAFFPYHYTTGGGTSFNGLRLAVTDANTFHPVRTSMVLLHTMAQTYGYDTIWRDSKARARWFDALYGNTTTGSHLRAGKQLEPLFARWREQQKPFMATRQRVLLYS